MRKIIEATSDKDEKRDNSLKALAGLAAVSYLDNSVKKRNRQKLMNDILYYLRKLLNLAKKVQSLSEGTNSEDDMLISQSKDFDEIKKAVDELEETIKNS